MRLRNEHALSAQEAGGNNCSVAGGTATSELNSASAGMTITADQK